MTATLLLLALSGLARAGSSTAADLEGDVLAPPPGSGPTAMPIINGGAAAETDYPQAGAMIIDLDLDLDDYGTYSLRSFTCSSTLIAPDVVLLASHCLDELAYTQGQGTMTINEIRWTRQADLEDWDGTSMRKHDWPEDSVAAADWVQNPDFSLRGMGLGTDSTNYDVALLFLDTAVTDTPFAYLPTADETDQIEEGAAVEIVGWGQQIASESASDLPDPGTFAIKEMAATVVGEVGDAEFQVGPDETDGRKCHGDSGGPTFINVETDSAETLRVVGVTSHSYDYTDCKVKGGVDTRVSAYLDWIDAELTSRCEDGSRVWCDETGIPAVPDPVTVADSDDTGEGGGKKTGGCSTAGGGASGLLGLLAAGVMLGRRRRA